MRTSDSALLERWRARRDAEAFNEIVSRYAGVVYATCRRVLKNDADAEDVTQECFLWLAREDVHIRACLGGWFHRLAFHSTEFRNVQLFGVRLQGRFLQRRAREDLAGGSDFDGLQLRYHS